MTEFKIGADPEIFLTKKGKAYSAHGVIPGTKKEPYPVHNGAIQVDGMAVEFNVEPVVLNPKGFEVFNEKVTSVLGQMKAKVKEFDNNLSFNISSVQDFPEQLLKDQPEEAKELGCDPDYCAYTLEVNPRPDGEVLFRTASGHIHIGWGADIPPEHPDHMEICGNFIKMMDATVGLFMTIIDGDPRRRILYGKAGAFRPKSYGVEYRTPSNLWLTTKDRRHAIFMLTRAAVNNCSNGYNVKKALKRVVVDEGDIREIINTGDFVRAYEILSSVGYCFYREDLLLKEFIARSEKEKMSAGDIEKIFKTSATNVNFLGGLWLENYEAAVRDRAQG